MRTSLEIYDALLQSGDRVRAVAELTNAELLEVSGMLLLSYEENDSSGEILGICLVERSARFASRYARPPKGGTTNGEGFL